MTNRILELPESRDVINAGPLAGFVQLHASTAVDMDRMVMKISGVEQYPLADVIPTMVFATVERMAFSMASAADISGKTFDPIAFGQFAERIAREMIVAHAQQELRQAEARGRA